MLVTKIKHKRMLVVTEYCSSRPA